MARRKRKYGAKEDKRPTLVEAMLTYRSFDRYALFSLLYVSGLSQAEAFRVAFNRFDLSPSAVACAASRMMRDARVQTYLFNVACEYADGNLRLNTDFPRTCHRLDWEDFEERRQSRHNDVLSKQ